MNFEMTNKELAEAIVAIHAIFMVPEQAVLCIEYSNHLKALLEIQRIRAEMAIANTRLNPNVDADIAVYCSNNLEQYGKIGMLTDLLVACRFPLRVGRADAECREDQEYFDDITALIRRIDKALLSIA